MPDTSICNVAAAKFFAITNVTNAPLRSSQFDNGNLRACYDHMIIATDVKPLTPSAWFLLGTCSMRLDEWGTALKAFSNVVTQRPDDCDAWANVAAIHIHNKAPGSAYPALNESLKQRRNNWRVWINKLYVCMDLGKIDEAIQALHTLIDFKTQNNSMKEIPDVDDKVVKNIIFTALKDLQDANSAEVSTDFSEQTKTATIDSKTKTLKRAGELLGRISSVTRSEPWVWELYAYYYERLNKPSHYIIEALMKLHRLLVNRWGNGEEEKIVERVCKVSVKVISLHLEIVNKEGEDEATKNEAKTKAAMLWRSLMKKVEKAFEFRGGEEGYPECVKEVASFGQVLI